MKKNIKSLIVVVIIGLLLGAGLTPIVGGTKLTNETEKIIIKDEGDNKIVKTAGGTTEYYAVIAACASYEDPGANLPIQEFKLKKLYRGLVSNDNWKDENIILLVNDNADPSNPGYAGGATKANVIKALGEMAGKVRKDDVFVFSW